MILNIQKKLTSLHEYIYPGQNIRLSAEFSNPVTTPNIEKVNWSLEDSNGNAYEKLPNGKDIDIKLLPDYSGTLNINVNALIRGESRNRTGSSSLHIVQNAPKKIQRVQALLRIPINSKLHFVPTKNIEIYSGSNQWTNLSGISKTGRVIQLNSIDKPIATWDGQVYIRYPVSGSSIKSEIIESLTIVPNTENNSDQ